VSQYIIRRIVLMVPVLLGLSLAIFLIMRVIPGDAASALLADSPTASHKDKLRTELGLNRPLYQQYAFWISGIPRGDFGTSFWTNSPVINDIGRAAPVTAELTLLASALALVLSLPVGILSAVRRNTIWDYLGRSASILGLSIPHFWLGTLVLVLPAVWWHWTPPATYHPIWNAPLSNLGQMWLPAIVIGLSAAAAMMRMVRSTMLEVLRQDYVRTARAKGLTSRNVILGHALKNAMIPVVTMYGTIVGTLLTGAIVTETIFNLPGFGTLTVNAIGQRDYPLIQSCVLIFGVVYVVANLLVDLSYTVLNPRIRYG